MERLTIIYNYDPVSDTWQGHVESIKSIVVYQQLTIDDAKDAMYWTLTNEMFYRYKSLTGWHVCKEIINYLPE